MHNKFGLSRDIPADIKRQVRQECGFGCVVCGASITEYEHISPEFNEAKSHAPENIALLCPTCHGKVTRKFYSKSKIIKARKDPVCKRAGFTRDQMDLGVDHPIIYIANSEFRDCECPILFCGQPLLRIQPPEIAGAPFRLSASFSDSNGRKLLTIESNIWQAYSSNWDIQFVGGRILVQDKPRSNVLALRMVPPRGIAIESLRMRIGDQIVEIISDKIYVTDGIRKTTLSGLQFGSRLGIDYW